MPLNISTKQIQIDKANVRIVVAVSIAAFVTVFSLVASKALISQRTYQSKVIAKKQIAKDTLTSNLQAANQLVASYKAFVETPDNVIGGNPQGQADRDGDNARIVLDALPSKYDFPALATSLDKILSSQNYNIKSITGTDDEVNQSQVALSATPQPIEIPFQVTVAATNQSLENLFTIFERSIRPMNIQMITLNATSNEVNVNITAKTYYQPEKALQIKKEVVK